MSLIYEAKLEPTKAELLSAWLPNQEWFGGDPDKVFIITGYRFDDPAGEVGMQGQVVTAGDGILYHVPLTYRGEPLAGAEDHLIGTMQHSVLGKRWVYDAVADPVFQEELTKIIATGGTESEEFTVKEDGSLVSRQAQSRVSGSGTSTGDVEPLTAAKILTEDTVTSAVGKNGTLSLLRHISPYTVFTDAVETLSGSWEGQEDPLILAVLSKP